MLHHPLDVHSYTTTQVGCAVVGGLTKNAAENVIGHGRTKSESDFDKFLKTRLDVLSIQAHLNIEGLEVRLEVFDVVSEIIFTLWETNDSDSKVCEQSQQEEEEKRAALVRLRYSLKKFMRHNVKEFKCCQ